jgi:hypothetical protein
MDKKLVNTEEQNRAVNPGDSVTQDDSISQEPAHNPSIDEHTESKKNSEDSSRTTPATDNDEVED